MNKEELLLNCLRIHMQRPLTDEELDLLPDQNQVKMAELETRANQKKAAEERRHQVGYLNDEKDRSLEAITGQYVFNLFFMDIQTSYQEAIKFATAKHLGKNQKVPGTNLPYLVHLSNTAMEILVASFYSMDFNARLAVQIALLHDTLEDTDTSYDELLKIFGKDIADGALALTKNHNLSKELRMDDCLERIKSQPKEIWAVKLADRITNLQPPPKHWSKEKKLKYQEEAKIIYQELKEGNKYLAGRLFMKIKEYNAFV